MGASDIVARIVRSPAAQQAGKHRPHIRLCVSSAQMMTHYCDREKTRAEAFDLLLQIPR
jgi:hypothetical protein